MHAHKGLAVTDHRHAASKEALQKGHEPLQARCALFVAYGGRVS